MVEMTANSESAVVYLEWMQLYFDVSGIEKDKHVLIFMKETTIATELVSTPETTREDPERSL